jgi:simple sugar transport system permease protein
VIWLNTNQYATGLALSLFGAASRPSSASATRRRSSPSVPTHDIPCCPTSPSSGRRCSASTRWSTWRSRSPPALAWFLYRSRAGLVLRAVGESPESAHALGYPVRRIRLAAVMVGGALCGLSAPKSR